MEVDDGLVPEPSASGELHGEMATQNEVVAPPETMQIFLAQTAAVANAQIKGDMDLLAHFRFHKLYNKYCTKKQKESLSSFLPDIPGNIDREATEQSSLMRVVHVPPIPKDIIPFSDGELRKFALQKQVLTEEDRKKLQLDIDTVSYNRRKEKKKKSKKDRTDKPKPRQHTVPAAPALTASKMHGSLAAHGLQQLGEMNSPKVEEFGGGGDDSKPASVPSTGRTSTPLDEGMIMEEKPSKKRKGDKKHKSKTKKSKKESRGS